MPKETPHYNLEPLDRRINYFNKKAIIQNFGDYLPQLLSDNMLLYPKVQADIYRLIGSVIESDWILRDLRHTIGSTRGSIAFWGCGMRNSTPITAKARSRSIFFGVRGPLTRNLLNLEEGTPIGDPGLLLPVLHDAILHPLTSNRSICIPHIHDPKQDTELIASSGAELVIRPDIESTELALREIINKITSSSFILTASLHGAIIAAAYKKPFAFWDNGHIDCPFKWEDFSASIGTNCTFVRTVSQGINTYSTITSKSIKLPPMTPILDCCPFSIKPDLLIRALVHDGILSEGPGLHVADTLKSLPSFSKNTLSNIYGINSKYSDHLSNPAIQIARIAMQIKEHLKKEIRTKLHI